MPTIDEAIERAARALGGVLGIHLELEDDSYDHVLTKAAKAALSAFLADVPVSGGWEGLPRQIIMWMDMEPKTPRALFNHLERSGFEVPQWMRDESEMQNLDHVPSKGTRAVLVFKAYCESLAEEIQ